MKPRQNSTVYLILSIMGAAFILVIALRGYSESATITLNDKFIVGGAFIGSCIFGISLAFRPGWPRRSSRVRGHASIAENQERRGRNMIGHHPDCEKFRSHIMEFRGRKVCSGCTGLALGSVLAIIFTIIYIALPVKGEAWALFLFLVVGVMFISMNLADIILSLGKSVLHSQINVLLVVGFFLVVVSVHQVTGSVSFGLLAIVISFLWLDTRIQLSSLRHREICAKCYEPCRMY